MVFLGRVIQIGLQFLDRIELLEITTIQRSDADTRRSPQDLQLCGLLDLALLRQSQPIAGNFALEVFSSVSRRGRLSHSGPQSILAEPPINGANERSTHRFRTAEA